MSECAEVLVTRILLECGPRGNMGFQLGKARKLIHGEVICRVVLGWGVQRVGG
jgi:hypothetical protein